MNYKFSTPKTISVIIVYFLLFLAGDLLGSLIFDFLFSIIDLPVRELYPIIRMPDYLLLTLIFFWLYTTKVLHLKMEDFGISFSVKWWGVSLSVLLPAFVVTIFLIIGRAQVNVFSTGDIFLIGILSILIALKAGILEEILFRGFIMRLLESKWNKYIAVLVPSVLFSFAHLPSMETFTIGGVFLLIISGTLVGTMFSLASYAGNSIGNNILMHTVWNFAIVTDILHITTSEGAYGEPIFQLIIPSDSILLTGAGFGIVFYTLPPPLSLRLSLLCFPLSKFPLPLLALEKGLYLREQDTGQGSEELPLQAVCAASVDLVSLGILAHGQSAVRCPSSFIEFFFCNYFTCELADHTWGSMSLFLNVTQHTEYGSQKQQATCSGREPDKKAAGPLCNTESDLLRLTGEQQILSVDLKIRF